MEVPYQLCTFNFEEAHATHRVWVQMGPKPGLDVQEKYIPLGNQTPVIQPAANLVVHQTLYLYQSY
jgi:hypothetical protein